MSIHVTDVVLIHVTDAVLIQVTDVVLMQAPSFPLEFMQLWDNLAESHSRILVVGARV